MPNPPFLRPLFVFQGALLRSMSGDLTGFRTNTEVTNDVHLVRIWPSRLTGSSGTNPCDYVAYFHYQQNDIEADTLFSLVCGDEGGVVGSSAELEVNSNYPEIPMSHSKFKFSQPGKGIQVEGRLPRGYTAKIALKFWVEGANIAPHDWIQLEISQLKNRRTIISVGKATLYPWQAPTP